MSGSSRIGVARVYDDPDADEGGRVLVDRLWPRGFRKGDPRAGRWIPKVAPSTELRKWYSHEAARFDEFAARYAQELETAEGAAAIDELKELLRGGRSRSSLPPGTSTAATSLSLPDCWHRLLAVQAASAVAAAAAFVWLGMVVAISFIETPLKFRAPGVTLQFGLGVGRLVFRVLNVCELALAAVVIGSFALKPPATGIAVAAAVAGVTLLAQVLVVRPRLTRRSDTVLAGGEGPRSRAHWAYVGGDCQGHRAADRGCIAARDVRRSPDAAGTTRPWHRCGCDPRRHGRCGGRGRAVRFRDIVVG